MFTNDFIVRSIDIYRRKRGCFFWRRRERRGRKRRFFEGRRRKSVGWRGKRRFFGWWWRGRVIPLMMNPLLILFYRIEKERRDIR